MLLFAVSEAAGAGLVYIVAYRQISELLKFYLFWITFLDRFFLYLIITGWKSKV